MYRSFKKEEFRVFLSKLAHTPGNILSYRAFSQDQDQYHANPSNGKLCVEILDTLSPKYKAQVFVNKIKKLKQIVGDPNNQYSEEWATEVGNKILNDFENLISQEFYSKGKEIDLYRPWLLSLNNKSKVTSNLTKHTPLAREERPAIVTESSVTQTQVM